MKKLLLLFFLLLPTPVLAEVKFEIWLSTDRLAFTVGRPRLNNVYIRNRGDDDSYSLTYVKNVENKNLVVVNPLKTTTEVVMSGNVTTIPVEINVLYKLNEKKNPHINFTVSSVTNPNVKKTASLYILSSIPQSLDEFSNYFLSLIILFSTLVFVYKIKS
ncbi:MAG TPA: hypothetical protein ENG34_00560 [Candidatus Aenigmarchaeota archaeon]|nr:hypothetical protein [Candidatus Aenigmarchaeota archaeon]